MTAIKPNKSFWMISILALIWNIFGVLAYLIQAFMTDEMIAQLPEEQQKEFLYDHPAWYTAIFALAVFGGFLGCLFLLLRKKVAFQFLVVSGICAIAQQFYLFFTVELRSYIMPIMIIVFSIFLIYYSKKNTEDGILT